MPSTTRPWFAAYHPYNKNEVIAHLGIDLRRGFAYYDGVSTNSNAVVVTLSVYISYLQFTQYTGHMVFVMLLCGYIMNSCAPFY